MDDNKHLVAGRLIIFHYHHCEKCINEFRIDLNSEF